MLVVESESRRNSTLSLRARPRPCARHPCHYQTFLSDCLESQWPWASCVLPGPPTRERSTSSTSGPVGSLLQGAAFQAPLAPAGTQLVPGQPGEQRGAKARPGSKRAPATFSKPWEGMPGARQDWGSPECVSSGSHPPELCKHTPTTPQLQSSRKQIQIPAFGSQRAPAAGGGGTGRGTLEPAQTSSRQLSRADG